jgi:hypothetical protein
MAKNLPGDALFEAGADGGVWRIAEFQEVPNEHAESACWGLFDGVGL